MAVRLVRFQFAEVTLLQLVSSLGSISLSMLSFVVNFLCVQLVYHAMVHTVLQLLCLMNRLF